jgi:hypothetical protein
MIVNIAKLRIYNLNLSRPLNLKNPECDIFRQYIINQCSGSRTLLEFNPSNDGDCLVSVRVQCYSFGKMGPNRLKQSISLKFPDVHIREIRRERKKQ